MDTQEDTHEQGTIKANKKQARKVLLRRPRPTKPQEINDIRVKQTDQDFTDLETPPASLFRGAPSLGTSKHSHSTLPKISKKDKKWILDSSYQSRQPTGFTRNGSNLIQPFKPRGPDALAAREVRRPINLFSEYMRNDEDIRYSKPPLFTLNDLTMKMAEKHRVELSDMHKIILSSANYKRITEVVAKRLTKHYEHIAFVDVDLDALDSIEEVQQKVPPAQVLFEMAALIKEQVKESLNFEVECKVKKLPRYAPGYQLGQAPHTEIILFEKQRAIEVDRYVAKDRITGHPTHESLFTSSPMQKHFQQNTRSSSPFTQDDNQISPSEICVLDCLLTGGIALSVKACFIDELPDISVLRRTLTYVNLSYNNFIELPSELLQLHSLQILKLRNNPLTALPPNIHLLQQLESLVVSFCLLSVLPITLYSLHRLRILDLSYNRISFLHAEIKTLKSLKFLNIEGNELTSLPNTMLRMQLRKIKVRNNFMHPLLWQENSVNQPQQLQDLAAISFYLHGLHRRYNLQDEAGKVQDQSRTVPQEIGQILVSQLRRCECCNGPSFGNGLRLIRPAKKLFSVRYLPLLFTACSTHCRAAFMKAEAQIPDSLYHSDTELSHDFHDDDDDNGCDFGEGETKEEIEEDKDRNASR